MIMRFATDDRVPGLHDWFKIKPSEPYRCRKCGTYYAAAKATAPCPAMRESA
jgi:rubrerythrin